MNAQTRPIPDLSEAERDALAAEMSPHVGDAFGTFTPTPAMVRAAIDGNTLIHVVRDDHGAIVASFMFQSHAHPDPERPDRLLWLDRAGVSRAAQGRGLARTAILELADRTDATFVGCTTQNPSLVSLFSRLAAPLWPLDAPYEDSAEGRGLRDWARATTRDGARAGDDGILRGLYGQRMGDHVPRPDLPAVSALYDRVGFSVDAGDSVLLVGRLRPRSRQVNDG